MILDLRNVFESEGFSRDFSYEFSMSDFEETPGEFPFKDPVKVDANLSNHAGVVSLHADTKAVYSALCDRCCEPIKENINVSFENVLVREAEGEGDNGDLIKVDDDKLCLDELVKTNIILNIPMKHLCSEFCKGLCPICGKNLNKGDCGCRKPNESPFNVLKDLIK